MVKYKIIHIHTDLKFINDSNRFINDIYENENFIIGGGNTHSNYDINTTFFDFSKKNLKKIINYCKSVDFVILYDLNFAKAYIANRLPKKVKIIWRFFGLELYSKIPHLVYSDITREILSNQTKNNFFIQVKNNLTKFYNKLRFMTDFNTEFENAAFERIDFFHGLSNNEYDFLKTLWPKLPTFLQIDFSFIKPNLSNLKPIPQKGKLVLIGNNKSAYNNHLDIIEILKKNGPYNKYKFLLLFNYGQNNNYTDAVKDKCLDIKEIKILENFLNKEEFNNLYLDTIALVINGYRQMAMGNIFEAFKNGTKVYLNEKNIILKWLREEGFLLSSIDDFAFDLKNELIELNENEITHNQNQLIKLASKYSQKDLFEALDGITNISIK